MSDGSPSLAPLADAADRSPSLAPLPVDPDGSVQAPSLRHLDEAAGANPKVLRTQTALHRLSATAKTAFRQAIRNYINYKRARKFNVKQLPKDMQRVFQKIKDSHKDDNKKHGPNKNGEDYALKVVFTMRTAVELHRAWHMTLLTSKVLQQLKEKFRLRMSWDLGVVHLKFRMDDGGHELHRRVPYDYDSEYQDKFMKVAVALVDDEIDIHQALDFQREIKRGTHTAPSGRFIQSYPGRLIVYPWQALTCAVIFFGGGWVDGGVAAVCGLAAGLVEWALGNVGEPGPVILDTVVGVTTGVVGSLFHAYVPGVKGTLCLSSIYLGTMYWFFYGTAFVIGLLEIIAGQLETGVTRFIAVSVKTFVLCLGASLGTMIVFSDTAVEWHESSHNCNLVDLDVHWWRIPLYLLCSASALAQYRYPLVDYWRGLTVQLAAYEVQYQVFLYFGQRGHLNGNMDHAFANILGSIAGVFAAFALAEVVEYVKERYYDQLLQRHGGARSNGLPPGCRRW